MEPTYDPAYLPPAPCRNGPVDYPECARTVRNLEVQIAKMGLSQEQIAAAMTRVCRILDGNGVEGLKTRMAKLEDHDLKTQYSKALIFKALVAAWLAFAANVLFYFLFRRPGP